MGGILMNFVDNKFDNYYHSCFSDTKLINPEQSLDAYNRCFNWCIPSDKNCRILDFGAGLGNLTFWLKSKGFNNIISIDVSRDQCSMAQQHGIDVVHVPDSLVYLKNMKNAFDIIFMSDVLEHIPKSQMIDYVNAIKNSLVKDGVFIVKTENISSPTGIYQHHMDFTHEYNFVEKSLRQLLVMCDFTEVEIRGYKMPWPKRPWLWWKPIVRLIYIGIIKIIYSAEQPRGSNNPKIFSNSLICRATRL